MEKSLGRLSVKSPYIWALVFSLGLIILVASFTPVSAQEFTPAQAPAADAPAYCTLPEKFYVVNKYGRGIALPSETLIYRVAGDRMNLSIGEVSDDAEVMHSLYLLTADRTKVIRSYGNFTEEGTLSFDVRNGVYAVGLALTADQYEACGGSGTFENVIETKDGFIVIEYYVRVTILQPTPSPRQETQEPIA